MITTHQRSKVNASVQSDRLYERWPAPSLYVAVVQRQAAKVAVQLQRHRVPAAVINASAGDSQHVAAVVACPSAAASVAEATGQLEPELPLLQLLTHTKMYIIPERMKLVGQGLIKHVWNDCDQSKGAVFWPFALKQTSSSLSTLSMAQGSVCVYMMIPRPCSVRILRLSFSSICSQSDSLYFM